MTEHTTAAAHRAFRAALAELCRDGTLVQRLEAAHRALAAIEPSRDLPPALRFRFEELQADIAYGADSVGDALIRMSAQDRGHLAGRVLSMYDEALRSLAAEG
jgi:hypothetical protein